METSRREKKLSSDSFSFPSTPTPDSDFEFGCLIPETPSSDPCITSPADHFFFDGRLLPHSFPFQTQLPRTCSYACENPRATSRTSIINSKDSFMSSRSNSTNSRSSCSSARTSASDSNSERKLLHQNKVKNSGRDKFSQGGSNKLASPSSSAQLQYDCSQRWQYITAVPSLSHETSRRSKVKKKKTKKKSQERAKLQSSQFWRRFLKWFVSACKVCHAL